MEKVKLLSNESLKSILYMVFDNYSNLSENIYIVIDEKECDYNHVKHDILSEVIQEMPNFMINLLFEKKEDSFDLKRSRLKVINEAEANNVLGCKLHLFKMYFKLIKDTFSYEARAVVDYIMNLDKGNKFDFLDKIESENKKLQYNLSEEDKNITAKKNQIFSKIEDENSEIEIEEIPIEEEEAVCDESVFLSLNDLYNLYISQTLWKTDDEYENLYNWIYNILNPKALKPDLFNNMMKTIEFNLTGKLFNSYVGYTLNNDENTCLDYISPSKDLYKLLLFDDILSADYGVNTGLNISNIATWWKNNILSMYKALYKDEALEKKLKLELKEYENIDFRGSNFSKLKYEIRCYISEELVDIDLDMSSEKEVAEDNRDDDSYIILEQIQKPREKNTGEVIHLNDYRNKPEDEYDYEYEVEEVYEEESEDELKTLADEIIDKLQEGLLNDDDIDEDEEHEDNKVDEVEETELEEKIEEEAKENNFVNDERRFLEKRIQSIDQSDILALREIFFESEIKYDENRRFLTDYYSEKVIDTLSKNNYTDYSLEDLITFIESNKDFLNKRVASMIESYIYIEIRNIEDKISEEIKDIKTLEALKVYCEDLFINKRMIVYGEIEAIVINKLENICKSFNLADVNSEENIKTAQNIFSIANIKSLENYPIAKMIADRDIAIDLDNIDYAIEDIEYRIKSINEIIGECEFSPSYYDTNIIVSDKSYAMKFKYFKDFIEYLNVKQGRTFAISLKNTGQDAKYKKRVFNKANSELLKEIDLLFSK